MQRNSCFLRQISLTRVFSDPNGSPGIGITPTGKKICDMLMLSAFIFFLGSVLHCSGRDTITRNPEDWLRNDGETLVSAGKTFELGFFNPRGSGVGRYVGVWYYRSEPPIFVWVANRDAPLPISGAPSAVFAIKENGELKVLDGNGSSCWSSGNKTSAGGRVVKLMDSGNLVLREHGAGKILWESFKNPTDTFLPGMKMDETLTLTSWVSPEDPSTGNYTFKLDEDSDGDQYITFRDPVVRYWSSKGSEGTPDEMTDAVLCLLSRSRKASCHPPAGPKVLNDSKALKVPFYRHHWTGRLVMSFSGEIQYYMIPNMPSPNWRAPRDRCSVSKACGNFGSCNVKNAVMCKCLPGFRPASPGRWNRGDFSGGCTRKSPICEKNSHGDGFLSLEMMEVRKRDSSLPVDTGEADYCRKTCLKTCECLAYAETYDRPPQCLFWTDELTDLQEECTYGAQNLSVRVALSDIKPTGRTCKNCGTNMVPYPLSTGPTCGDPKYSKFKCGVAPGQLHFVLPVGHYRVTRINPDTLTFGIQMKKADCSSRDKITSLDPPFSLAITDACEEVRIDNSGSEMPLANNSIVVMISWEPPPEPACTSSADCKDWQHSSCRGRSGTRRCFCNKGFRWNSSSISCVEEFAMAAGTRKWPLSSPAVVIGITVAVTLAVALGVTACYMAYLHKRNIARRKERRSLQLYDSGSRVKHLIDSEEFKEEDKEGIDVPLFDIEDILVATDNFSDANRLGRGGFGTVYKGKSPEGQYIAVKRLSRSSGQGLQEFKNEVVLIAKLQHRNLVRLLGYCVEGEEKILVYEYLRNKSLDYFVFDRNRCKLLNWEKRFDIILGIARGLVYLHQDSRLKIIHRDLKTSNVLLDDDMNPKISNFGLARIFDSKQEEANTNRVAGTYGYMSPEYALEGLFSEKSDVFSFGVMVIEIISGKRSTGYYHSEADDRIFSLTGHAWKLWEEEKVLEMMDQAVKETCNKNEVMRCVKVGLLCVQEDPKDRPTMAVALVMLSSETHVEMPLPKQPAFAVKRDFPVTASSSSSSSSSSKHEPSRDLEMIMLASIEEGR